MAGLGMAILGGALEQVGTGIAEKGKALRDAKLRQLEQEREFQFRSSEAGVSRDAQVAENKRQEGVQAANAQGEMVDLGGGRYGVRKGSTVEPLKDSAGNPVDVQVQSGYRLLTPEEKTANGLDPNKSYQMALGGADKGKVSAIGGEGTTVNVGSEKGFDKQAGEDYAKYLKEIRDAENSGRRSVSALNIMEKAMQDPNFYSGAGAEKLAGLRRAAVALGGDPNQVSSVETFNAMAKQAALDSMGGSLGTGFSNADRDFVEGQVPTLANTPEGNKALIGVQKKIAQRKIAIAQQARTYAKAHDGRIDIGFDDELAAWAEKNPLFAAETAGAPKPGAIEDGYRFKGGNPADQNSWEREQ